MHQQHPEDQFRDPPREFGIMPFWFWNDDLDENEIRRQIQEFHAKGFGGFIPHARVGLSRRIGYLTGEFFRLIRIAVEEAAALGMKVVLYDEGSYPSGSAQGRVVAENPAYAARCLVPVSKRIEGPARGYWRPNPSRAMKITLLGAVQAREIADNTLDPNTITPVETLPHDVLAYDVPEGAWQLISYWETFSGGTIRGVFDQEDDHHAQAPAAGDLLNPDAVACFLRSTHDAYYDHVGDHFGTTVVAMFTDEPNPMGRGARCGPDGKPFTTGFLEDVQDLWDEDVHLWLPALWYDCGPNTESFRHTYERAVQDRLGRTFYAAQSDWCVKHGIALTGHPAHSDEMGAFEHFHWPGQDIVWRWVEPGEKALAGPHSVVSKAASSAAVTLDRPRNANEAFGAFGWRLTLDEVKWLSDWQLVRGTDLFFSHACFYSIRGRRAFESEPDLGVHNVWWPHFGMIADYVRRMCWTFSGGDHVCDIAILTDPNAVAWKAASELMRSQIDFNYITERDLARAKVEGGRLAIGRGNYRAVVIDGLGAISADAHATLIELEDAGGLLVGNWGPTTLASSIAAKLGRDVDLPDAPDLRVRHIHKHARDFYMLVNEGEETITGELSIRAAGGAELWNPFDGTVREWPARQQDGRTVTTVPLERREAAVLVIDPARSPNPNAPGPVEPGEVVAEVPGPWRAEDTSGTSINAPCPGDWAQAPGWETFSGSLSFRTEFDLTPDQASAARHIDLGHVGDIAKVRLNKKPVGTRAWAPYRLDIAGACRPGQNVLEVAVTNSMANEYDGLQLPSGLQGPILLRT